MKLIFDVFSQYLIILDDERYRVVLHLKGPMLLTDNHIVLKHIFDFQLDEEDKKQIEQLDLGYSEIIDHQNYMTAKWLNKYKIHD